MALSCASYVLFVVALTTILGTVAGKPGVCPNPALRGPGLCTSTCNSDEACAGFLKCCPNSCGAFTCAYPEEVQVDDYPPEKPGTCPPVSRRGLCSSTCASDQQCAGALKCCTNKCGASTCAFPMNAFPSSNAFPPTNAFPPAKPFPSNNAFPPTNVLPPAKAPLPSANAFPPTNTFSPAKASPPTKAFPSNNCLSSN